MYDYLGGKSMTDAEQREAARQFVNRWMGKGKEDDVGRILRTFKIKKNVEVTDNGKIII